MQLILWSLLFLTVFEVKFNEFFAFIFNFLSFCLFLHFSAQEMPDFGLIFDFDDPFYKKSIFGADHQNCLVLGKDTLTIDLLTKLFRGLGSRKFQFR